MDDFGNYRQEQSYAQQHQDHGQSDPNKEVGAFLLRLGRRNADDFVEQPQKFNQILREFLHRKQ